MAARRHVAWAVIGLLATAPAVAPVQAQTSFEDEVLAQLNAVRQNPAGYVEQLRRYRSYYRAKLLVIPGAPAPYITAEGSAAVDEAIAYVQEQAHRAPLAPAAPLATAAADHVSEQEADGEVGHVGADGSTPSERLHRRGGGIYVAEVIAYGSDSAADMVRQLIVDDGVPDRGHRSLILADNLRFAGVSCGSHPTYRTMCVVDMARTEDGRSIAEAAAERRADHPPVTLASLR